MVPGSCGERSSGKVHWNRKRHVLRGPPQCRHGPDFDVPELSPGDIVAHHDSARGASPGCARPYDVGITRVGRGESALAAAHAAPLAARDTPVREQPSHARVGGAPERRTVLAVAQHIVGDRVVGGDVVHLRDRQLHPEPGATPVLADRESAVVRHRDAVGIERVAPDVVVVPAGSVPGAQEVGGLVRFATVKAHAVAGRQEVDLVAVVGGHAAARVVCLARGEIMTI